MSEQKFFRGQRVYVDGFHGYQGEAIVAYSYSDVFSHRLDTEDYAIVQLKGGKRNKSAWYPEEKLTLLSDDRHEGERLLQEDKR